MRTVTPPRTRGRSTCPRFQERSAREIRDSDRVRSPGTVTVVDYSPPGQRPQWLATEYVPAPSLDEWVARHGPLPEAALLSLAAEPCGALQAVHQADLTHRDVKPGNVLPARDRPRLIGFRIARAADDPRHTRVGGTRPGHEDVRPPGSCPGTPDRRQRRDQVRRRGAVAGEDAPLAETLISSAAERTTQGVVHVLFMGGARRRGRGELRDRPRPDPQPNPSNPRPRAATPPPAELDRRGVDHEPVPHVTGQHPLVRLVDLGRADQLDLRAEAVLGAEVQHLLGLLDAADA